MTVFATLRVAGSSTGLQTVAAAIERHLRSRLSGRQTPWQVMRKTAYVLACLLSATERIM